MHTCAHTLTPMVAFWCFPSTHRGISHSTSNCPNPLLLPAHLQGHGSRKIRSPCHKPFLWPSSGGHFLLLWIPMMFYLGLPWSLSLSGLHYSCLCVLHIMVKRKEWLLAAESDGSEEESQVHPPRGGWPWENTNSWEPPFCFLAKT